MFYKFANNKPPSTSKFLSNGCLISSLILQSRIKTILITILIWTFSPHSRYPNIIFHSFSGLSTQHTKDRGVFRTLSNIYDRLFCENSEHLKLVILFRMGGGYQLIFPNVETSAKNFLTLSFNSFSTLL